MDLPPLLAISEVLRQFALQALNISKILLANDGAAFEALGVVVVFSFR